MAEDRRNCARGEVSRVLDELCVCVRSSGAGAGGQRTSWEERTEELLHFFIPKMSQHTNFYRTGRKREEYSKPIPQLRCLANPDLSSLPKYKVMGWFVFLEHFKATHPQTFQWVGREPSRGRRGTSPRLSLEGHFQIKGPNDFQGISD